MADINVIIKKPEYKIEVNKPKYDFNFSQCVDSSFKNLIDTPADFLWQKWKFPVVDENEENLVFKDLQDLKYSWNVEVTVASEDSSNPENYDFQNIMDFLVWFKTEYEPKASPWTHLNIKLASWIHLLWYDSRTSGTLPLALNTLWYTSLTDIEINWESDDNRAIIQIKNDQATDDFKPYSIFAWVDATIQFKYVDFDVLWDGYNARNYAMLYSIRAKISLYNWHYKDIMMFSNISSYVFTSDTVYVENSSFSWAIALNNSIIIAYKTKIKSRYWFYCWRISKTYLKNVDTSECTNWITPSSQPLNTILKDGSIIVDETAVKISYLDKEETITAKKTHNEDIEISDTAKWVILTSPWWDKFRLKVDNNWALSTEAI